MSNDYYKPVNRPRDFTRARGQYVSDELARIEDGFKELPSKDQLAGGLTLEAAETSASVADAYVLTGTYPVAALVKGMTVHFFNGHLNTGPPTVDLDGTGEVDIKRIDGADLSGGEMPANWPVELRHNGIDWLLLNSAKSVVVLISFDEAVSSRNFQINSEIAEFVLPAATGGAAPLVYSIASLPSGMAFAAGTRTVSGTPTDLGNNTVIYTVTDDNGIAVSVQFSVRIVATVLALPAVADRNFTEGNEYEITLPVATGGTAPLTYTLGGLPEGLQFDPESRILSGTPEENGTFGIAYRVVDSGDPEQIDEVEFDLVIDYPSTLALAQPIDRELVPDEEITAFFLPAASGGRQPYEYIVTGLPTGLLFDDETREVSGTPTSTGESTVTYRVRDDRGDTVDRTFEIDITHVGRRYIAVIDDGAAVTALILQSGNNYASDEQTLTLPDWTGNKKILIAQPELNDDLTSISLGGFGNSLSDFEKLSSTFTISGVTYEVWRSVDVQGGDGTYGISGDELELRT